MTYSLLATNISTSILHDFQATTYRMIRIILGDHSYRTRTTHQQVFNLHNLDHPLDMLRDLATSLLHRLHRRAISILPTDILHKVDWTSIYGTLHLIASIRNTVVEVPIALDPAEPVLTQALLQCSYCNFSTSSVSNLRRHLTTHHGTRQYRTSSILPAAVAHHGAPQCKHCLQIFTTWNSFYIHVQRECCQVMLTATPSCPADAEPHDPVPLTALPAAASLNFHVGTQAFWPELQTLILHADWARFPRNADMLEYLTHHCAICGLWCNRFQELHGHYRQCHPDHVQGCVAKGAQISMIMQTMSPCPLCQRPYSRVHSCPTTLQLGMLQIQLRPQADRLAVACTCDICSLPFADLGQLYGHLTNSHGLTVNDWCPSRDSHQGGDGCRHCGMIFDSRSGLRRHITEGRCEAFNPAATPHPLDTTDKWGPWLRTSNFDSMALTAHMRLQLTTVCQFCGLAYSRTGDLVAHLMQSHGDLWSSSQPWLRFLLQAVMARKGCLCNPQSHDMGVTHVCALLRQTAMMIHSQDIQLFVPTQFLRSDLETALACLQHEVLQTKVIQALTTRDFAQLWQDADVLEGLRTRCLTCGGHYTPAVLLHHLLVQHPQTCVWATQIAFQLHHLLQALQNQDYRCDLCQQVFNLPADAESSMTPDRCQLQYQHFATNCPVVLQIAALLHPLHGRPDGPQRPGTDGWSSSAGSTVAGSQKTLGWKRRSPAQAPQSSLHRRRTGRSLDSGHDRHAAPDGTAHSEPRTGHPTSASTGLLRFVCTRPPRGHHPTSDGACPELAGTGSEASGRPEMAQPENPLDGGSGGRASSTSATTGSLEAGRPTLGSGGGEGYPPPGRELGLSEMVPRNEAAEEGTPHSPADDPNAATSSVAGGAVSVEQSHTEVPQPENRSTHGTLASSTLSSRLRRVVPASGPLPEHSLVPVRDVGQTAQHVALETGCPAPADLERSSSPEGEIPREREGHDETFPENLTFRDRQRLRALLLDLQLNNSGTSCYANSAFLAYLWACLSRTNFQFLDWGARTATLQTILNENDGTPFPLDAQDWFLSLLQGWNDPQGQADSAEFGHRFARWLALDILSNSWERRVTASDVTEVHDHGDQYMPLTLQLDPTMTSEHEISLTALLRHWSQELGMCAGLTDPRDLLAIHIDRLVMTPGGALYKHEACITFAWEVHVPVLQTGTTLHTVPYTIVAVTAHLGDQKGGHYQTMLRTYPEVSDLAAPSMWMFCDDCRLPTRTWLFPDNFSQGITGFWLCRTDKLEMHLMEQPHTPAVDLLTVLHAQPSVPLPAPG